MLLPLALIFITLACILYTVAVWSEKIQGRLKTWHLVLFWSGLAADTVGTGAMGLIHGSIIQFTFHGITGLFAIGLMLIHTTWASLVLVKKNERMILKFHKLSFMVWIFWLIPMITGMIFGASV